MKHTKSTWNNKNKIITQNKKKMFIPEEKIIFFIAYISYSKHNYVTISLVHT